INGFGAGKFDSWWKYEVASDTGTSFIGAPRVVTDKIARAVGATVWHNTTCNAQIISYYHLYLGLFRLYHIHCNAKPSPIVIYIGGKPYPIDYKNYIVEVSPKLCVIAFFSINTGGNNPAWLLGDPFIRQYCHIHDLEQKRIGFAKSIAK
ncbi:unnamed protein product, partial [Strongylus vulgaris]